MKVLRGFALGLLVLLAAVLLVLSCLPFRGWGHVLFDTLSALRPHFFAAGLVLGTLQFVLVIRRRTTARIAGLVLLLPAMIINGRAVLPLYLRPAPPDLAAEPSRCRLLCFNVQQKNRSFDEVVGWVQEADPDIAIFLEARNSWPERLRPLSRSHPHHLSFPVQSFEIYSRVPITSHRMRPVGTLRGDVVLQLANGLTVVAGHAYTDTPAHGLGFELRNKQLLGSIGRNLADEARPLVVIGDLNVSPWSPYFGEMIARSGLRDARRGAGPLPSYSRIGLHRLLGVPIDHCLTSPDIRVDRLRTGPALGSDHLPLVAELSF